jgi:hypothetical protein
MTPLRVEERRRHWSSSTTTTPTTPHLPLLPRLQEVTDGQPWAERCVFKRYEDQTHGFCAARGNWTRPEVAAGATDAVERLAQFFTANLA